MHVKKNLSVAFSPVLMFQWFFNVLSEDNSSVKTFFSMCVHVNAIMMRYFLIIIALTYGHTLEKKVLTLELSSESTLKNY